MAHRSTAWRRHSSGPAHSLPVLNALKVWLDNIAPKIVPDTKLGDAVSYTLNQWDYLTRYTSDGNRPIGTACRLTS
ncbi:IS66 family transposase [Rhizobium ruizarguesonis]|uniref:IS66 family transposase n=1 Tax=Rhizobium ruizarguesonis TaxID=2081791 RepID=UPI0010311EC3|nr:transposase [Rhizobium ruizarguesonis]TAV22613.1 hypothetical protein ELI35_31195 [Rhizobium ruizarguesonis]